MPITFVYIVYRIRINKFIPQTFKTMKTIFTLMITLFSYLVGTCQITLDHDFPNQRLDLIHLKYAGLKYYQHDYTAHTGTLLNLDYSVFKTITFPSVPNTSYSVGLFTEDLFDTDTTTIEYVLSFTDVMNSGFRIYSMDSILLFQADSGATIYANDYGIYRSSPNEAIFNTDSGTKMIVAYTLPFSSVYHTSVYNLPGQLHDDCYKNTLTSGIVQVVNKSERLKSYPNPFKDLETIEYSLPPACQRAMLQITDAAGKLIKQIRLSAVENKIELIDLDIPAGQYVISIVADDVTLASRKVVKVN